MTVIRGKVAKILNSRELVMNVGNTDGVKVGMVFRVLDIEEDDIVDPDSGVNLGSLERTKVKVKIDLVKKRMSIAKTYQKKTVNIGGSAVGMVAFAERIVNISDQLTPPQWVDKYETLKLPDDFEPLDESDSIVNIGDIVISTIEEDDL